MTEENNQAPSKEEALNRANDEAKRAARIKRIEESRELLAKLSQEYPEIFPQQGKGRPKALAIGMHKALTPIVQEWGYSAATLRSALAWYTKQLRYHYAMLNETHRYNLDGSEAEAIEEEHKAVAKSEIERIEAWLAEHRPETLERREANRAKRAKERAKRGEAKRPRRKSGATPQSSKSAAPKKDERTLEEKMQSLMNKFNQ